METSLAELRQKEAINVCDGKRLGRICDVVFTYPEGKVLGLVVPGGRGFRFGKADLFIDLKNVVKIGVDVVLVNIKVAPKPSKKKNKWEGDYPPDREEPPHFPPPPNDCRPPKNDRRDYGEYE